MPRPPKPLYRTRQRRDPRPGRTLRPADHQHPTETATIGWATYLHRATLHLHRETRTHDTGRLLIELAHRRATSTALLDLRGLTTRPLDQVCPAGRTVAARFQVVAVLHTCGLCEPAEREAIAALSQWASHHHDAPDVTYTYLVETLTVLDRCGRTRQGLSVLNAYGGLLPEADTDAGTFLLSYATHRLGNRRQIQRHQRVCGIRPQRRHCHEHLRTAILNSLAYDDHSKRLPIPTTGPRLATHAPGA